MAPKDPMHIVLVNGSPRKRGATAQLLHAMEHRLGELGASTEFVNLSDLAMAPCSGCCACYRTGRCHIDDDAERLSERLATADGVVVGSPTYASNVSGILKTFIDRGHFVIEQLLHHAYAVSVVTGENYGNREASAILTRLLSYSGARISGKLVCTLPFNSRIDPNDPAIRRARACAERLARDIGGRRAHPLQALAHAAVFSFGIKPFVLKKGAGYQGVLQRWEKRGVR